MSHFYLTIWIQPGCFGSDLLNSISISSTFCSKILSSETSNSAATGTLSGLDFWPATPRLSSHVPPLCLSLYLGAGLAEEGPRSREKQWTSDGAVLTGLLGGRGERQAEVRVVFCVQPPLVLLSAPSHAVQTNPCGGKWEKNKDWSDRIWRRSIVWRTLINEEKEDQRINVDVQGFKTTRKQTNKQKNNNPPFK